VSNFAARFIGFQETADGSPTLALYNLLEDIEGHPKGSTVSFETLRGAGVSWTRIPIPRVPEVRQLSEATKLECGLAEPELSEEDQMREAYEITDPKHPDYIDHCQWLLDTIEDR
jgi:hypothetical protein